MTESVGFLLVRYLWTHCPNLSPRNLLKRSSWACSYCVPEVTCHSWAGCVSGALSRLPTGCNPLQTVILLEANCRFIVRLSSAYSHCIRWTRVFNSPLQKQPSHKCRARMLLVNLTRYFAYMRQRSPPAMVGDRVSGLVLTPWQRQASCWLWRR